MCGYYETCGSQMTIDLFNLLSSACFFYYRMRCKTIQEKNISLSLPYKTFTLRALPLKGHVEQSILKTQTFGICLNLIFMDKILFFSTQINSITHKLQICLKICRIRQRITPIMYCYSAYCTIKDCGIQWIYHKEAGKKHKIWQKNLQC